MTSTSLAGDVGIDLGDPLLRLRVGLRRLVHLLRSPLECRSERRAGQRAERVAAVAHLLRRLRGLLLHLLRRVEAELLVDGRLLRIGGAFSLEGLLLAQQRRHGLRRVSGADQQVGAEAIGVAFLVARPRRRQELGVQQQHARLILRMRAAGDRLAAAAALRVDGSLRGRRQRAQLDGALLHALDDVGVGVAENDVRRLVSEQRRHLVLVVEAQQRPQRDIDVRVGGAVGRPVAAGAHVDLGRYALHRRLREQLGEHAVQVDVER